jgi:very-short-patch-repair endonuclease
MHRDGPISQHNAAFSARRGWEVAVELAAAQYGVVALSQLTAVGIPAGTVRGWLAGRRLVRLYQGVFAVGHAVLRAEGHYLAGVFAGGEGAALSYRSAGALLDIRAYSGSYVDVTTPARAGRCRRGLRIHRGDRLTSDEVMVHHAIPCTTIARTLLDLAVVLDQRGVEQAVERCELLEILDLRTMTILLSRHFGRRGTARLRRALTDFDREVVRARTETEARFYHLCADRQLERPRVNRLIHCGSESFEVDFHWPEQRLIVEADSPYHDTIAAAKRDAHRDAALRACGWEVIRVRWEDIVDNPEPLVFLLRQRLAIATG